MTEFLFAEHFCDRAGKFALPALQIQSLFTFVSSLTDLTDKLTRMRLFLFIETNICRRAWIKILKSRKWWRSQANTSKYKANTRIIKGVMYTCKKYIGYIYVLFHACTLKETLFLPSFAKSICFTFMESDAIYWPIKLEV